MRNKYVTVVVAGQLDVWTGKNPDKFPGAKREALGRAQVLREKGKTAYAVTVEEILPSDIAKECIDCGRSTIHCLDCAWRKRSDRRKE